MTQQTAAPAKPLTIPGKLAIMPTKTETNGYRLDDSWPKYPPDMQFEMGAGVTVDDRGIIYLYHRDIEHWASHPLAMSLKMGKGSVSMWDREGNYLGKWGKSDEQGFALTPHAAYFIDGNFWFADRDGHTVKKYDRQGNLLIELGTFGEFGKGPKHFNGPTGVAVQKNGNIVITDGYWISRLIWFSPEGEYIREIGGWGYGPTQLIMPHAVTQAPDGRLLVVDHPRGILHPYCTVPGQIAEHRKYPDPTKPVGRIRVYDEDGVFLEKDTEKLDYINPLSVATYGDRIYASDNNCDLIALDGSSLEEIERYEELNIYIHQMAMDAHGDIYVASVCPEHAAAPRGREGPSHRHWMRLTR